MWVFLHGFFSGLWLCADDIILLAASETELQKIVNICVMENEKLDLSINVTKSGRIRVGRKFKFEVEKIKVNDVIGLRNCVILVYVLNQVPVNRLKIDLHENRAFF